MTDKQAEALQKAREAAIRKRQMEKQLKPKQEEKSPDLVSTTETNREIPMSDFSVLSSKLDKLIELNTAILEVLKKNSTSDKLDLSKIIK